MIRANRTDFLASIAILGASVFPIVFGAPKIVKKYKMLVRIIWILAGVAIAVKKLYLSAIILIVAGFAVQYGSGLVDVQSELMAQFKEAQLNDPRFNEDTNLDLQTARGTLKRDPARWFDPGRKKAPILLFPPSPEQLDLIGNNGNP